jgi:hypothetical protein
MKSDPETDRVPLPSPPRRPRPSASVGPLLAVALLAGAPAAFAAPSKRPIEVETLRVGFVSGPENNLFKLGKWTPLWVQLRAGPERFSGVLEVVVPDDDGTPTSVRQMVDVAPGASERFTTYARPGTSDPEFDLRLFDRGGRRVASVPGDSLAKLDAIRPDEMLVLVLGNPSGVDLIPKLPGFNADAPVGPGQGRGDRALTVARLDKLAGMIPGRWIGYDAVEAIVLDTNDRDLMTKLNTSGGQAVRDWVRRGGHLVVSVGSDWSRLRDSFLLAPDDPILPALPVGQERIDDLGALESFAGASRPITAAGAPPVLVTKLDEVEARGGKVLIGATGSVPLVVRGPYGFGRVTVVALDVDQNPFAAWEDRPRFWLRALDLRRQTGDDAAATGTVANPGGRVYRTGVSDLATQLRRALEQFRGVTLIPFGWVAFFIFLYILLIGPGDYLLLKKVFKRMELTWITFPTIVVTVSVLAYYAAYLVKGNVLRVNLVDIVDVDQPSGLARGNTFLTLFSPQNRDYDVSVVPLPLDGPAATAPADASATAAERPPAGTEVVLSWFGVPEPGFGGMGGNSQFRLSGGGYSYDPMGVAEILTDVRIPIWSTRSFTARWFGPAPTAATVDADLVPVGTDRLNGSLTNRLDVPLQDAHLAFGQQVYSLGDIAPGASVRVELTQDRNLSGYLKANMNRYLPDQPWNAQEFTVHRGDLLTALMFHDSGATATRENPVASIPLHYLDLTGQLALDRPMLFARINRPATRLALGHAPRPPQIERTTMLRVILPLKKAGDEGASTKPDPAPNDARRAP